MDDKKKKNETKINNIIYNTYHKNTNTHTHTQIDNKKFINNNFMHTLYSLILICT